MIPQNLSELDHFRDDPRVQFKEETVNGVAVVIPVYMIADSEFWTIPNARELRGHTYLKSTGDLIGVALHKFFNVGERTETLPGNINWGNINTIMDKLDGSMINPVVVGGSVRFKTKKSFSSDVAKEFEKWFFIHPYAKEWVNDIYELWRDERISPIFEFYHPDWQVVLNYGDKPQCWWVASRDIKGNYYQYFPFSRFHGMECRGTISTYEPPEKILETAKTKEGVEGWVLYDSTLNELYKIKTAWYLQQHRVRTQMRERDVAELAALERLDDVKSIVSAAGLDLSKIEVIEKSVSSDISFVRSEVENFVQVGQTLGLDIKGMALNFQNHLLKSLILRTFKGQPVSYVEYFLKNILKEKYSLKNVYNEKF